MRTIATYWCDGCKELRYEGVREEFKNGHNGSLFQGHSLSIFCVLQRRKLEIKTKMHIMPKNHSLVKTALNGGFSYFRKDLRHMLLPKKRKRSVPTLITFDNNFKDIDDLVHIFFEVLVAEWFCHWPVTRETGVQFPFRMKHF